MILSFLAILQVLHCAFFLFHSFQYFLPYCRSNWFFVSFSTFFTFLAIILVLQCVFLIFLFFFSFSGRISPPTVFVSHFPSFSVF
jgi:hypothetical protein